jgi:hypothetical protein
MKRVGIFVAAALAIGTGVGFAATLNVGSDHLWAGTQTLTKSTCTLTGTTTATDTYVSQASPSSSFGSGTTLVVQPNTGSQEWAFIRFDLSSCAIPATGGADSATLKLTITSAPRSSRTLTVTPVLSTWSNTTTWNAAQSLSYDTPTTTFATGTSTGTLSIPVTVDVDALIKSSTANDGWRISDGGSTSTKDTTTFASSNATSGKPQLVINYEK